MLDQSDCGIYTASTLVDEFIEVGEGKLMSVENDNQEESAPETPRSPYAMLVELEGVAANVRRAEYEALCNLITDGSTPMNMILYVQHCINRTPKAYLKTLLPALGSKTKDLAGLAKQIEDGVSIYLTSADAQLHPRVAELIAAALERQMDVAFVTGCPEAAAKAALERWGAPYGGLKVHTHTSSERPAPDLDEWLRAAKSISRPARQCVALAGSHLAVKEALAATMRCIAVPDEYTAFEDFSGASVVLDAEVEDPAAALLDSVVPAQPFI